MRKKGGGLQGQNVRLEREAMFPGNTIPECAIESGGKDRMCIRATQEARAQSQDTEQDAELGKQRVQVAASSFPDLSENSNLHFNSHAKEEKKASIRPSLTTLGREGPLLLPKLVKDSRKHFSQLIH